MEKEITTYKQAANYLVDGTAFFALSSGEDQAFERGMGVILPVVHKIKTLGDTGRLLCSMTR